MLIPSDTQSEEKKLFETIYRLAEAKDSDGLTQIEAAGNSLGIIQNGYSPVMLLAQHGKYEAVEFLIDNFKANLNFAVKGYALGGHVHLVNQLIASGASRSEAAREYAQAGRFEQVNQLLAAGASQDLVVLGYACGGYIEQVNQLISAGARQDLAVKGFAYKGYDKQVDKLLAQVASRNSAAKGYACCGRVDKVNALLAAGAEINAATEGYAYSGNFEQVNQLLAAGANPKFAVRGYAISGYVKQVNQLLAEGASRNTAIKWYAYCGHFSQVNQLIAEGGKKLNAAIGYSDNYLLNNHEGTLRIASYVDDDETRKLVISEAASKINNLNQESMFEKATKINRIMSKYQLNYKQAKSLTVTGARTWLLQGQALVRNKVIIADMFLEISSSILELPPQDTKKVLSAVCKNIFEFSVENTASKFTHGFFTREQYLEEQKQIVEQYESRMIFK